jgi:hypothetical protein
LKIVKVRLAQLEASEASTNQERNQCCITSCDEAWILSELDKHLEDIFCGNVAATLSHWIRTERFRL